MKKNFIMIALASVLMMPVSCTKNELEAPQGPAAGELTFVAYAEGGDSKTTLNEEDGSVAWAIGDQIKFDYELDKVAGEAVLSSVLAEGNIVEGAATFTAALPEAFTMSTKEYEGESRHMYVTYPASIETDYSSASEFLVTIPAEQDGTFANASIALAKWYPENPTAPLQFYNLCGLLQIEIADDAARQIVLEASSDLVGNVSVTFTKEGYEGLPIVKAVKEGTKTITVDVIGAGVYYVAVLPGSIENLYVAINDAEGNLLGDRTANNAIPVARKQIRKLGTIGTGFSDRYYVKTTAAGSGDGSSWDNAADYATLMTKLKATNSELTVYMASGTYKTGEVASMGTTNTGADITIFGGYPAEATGMGVSGRDYTTTPTVLDAESKDRILVLQVGSWRVDGLTFKNAKRGSTATDIGSALMLEGKENASFIINNCTFDSNQNLGSKGGGAVRVSNANADFNNCAFTNNQSNYFGSAVYVNGTSVCNMTGCTFSGNKENKHDGTIYVFDNSTLNLNDCTFSNNVATRHAGAIACEGILNAVNCHFEGNSAGTKGGAVWARPEATVKMNLDGCYFKGNASTSATGGGAVCVETAAEFSASDCTFEANTASVNGGAVLFVTLNTSKMPSFTNCKFVDNMVASETENTGLGSAVAAAGTGSGYATFDKCLFDGNVAYNGGALWTRSVSYNLTDCSFVDNNSTNGGGTIFVDGSNAPAVYCDACYFSYTAEANVGSTPAISINKGTFGMNNSVFAGSWGGNAKPQIANASTATIVNSTLYGQIGGGIITNSGTCCVINSIVPNAASSGKGKSVVNTGTLTVDHSLYYSIDGTENLTATGSLAGVIVRKDTESNFPNDGNVWYSTDYVTMYKNDQTTKEQVSDVRGYLHYYKWTGSVPAIGESKYTKATSEKVATAVQTADADFYNWVSASLFKDIRGVSRNTAAMWPGSYEDATATAGLESLNVK